MLDKIFEVAMKNKSLIGIRTIEQEWDETIVGFIIKKEGSNLLVKEIDEFGRFIGNTSLCVDVVISIDINDRYQEMLSQIHKNRHIFNDEVRETIWNRGVLVKRLPSLKKNRDIATFFFAEDNYVIGVLLDYDKNYLQIKNIGEDGLEDGMSIHLVSELQGLRLKGLLEQKVMLLMDWHAKK